MAALLALIPGKDLIYGALILALIAGGVYEYKHIEALGAAHEVAALKESSDKLQVEASAHVQELATNYATTVAKITETNDAQTQTANAQLASAAERVRDYDAYRRSHQTVGGPATAAAIAGGGAGSTSGSDDKFTSLEQVAIGLASAVTHSSLALISCAQERAALTGK